MTFTACVAHETRANASLNLQISNDGYWRWTRELVSLYTSVAHNSDSRWKLEGRLRRAETTAMGCITCSDIHMPLVAGPSRDLHT